ncbi:YtxH domain-containing protein [Salinimicrobium terrae]|uniref:YtxH domain-containing protein n=1 Tax=Salinimicrobium terrae TaxID=470866 RepID=UPI000413C3E5
MAKSGSTFLALLTGAAIGAGLGMLYAPESGEETRRKLGDNARRTQDDLNKRYKETSSNLSQKAKKAKSDFEQRLEETLSSASYKADEILSSLETKLDELKRQNAKFQKDRQSLSDSNTNTGSGSKANKDNADIDSSVASKGSKNTGSATV